MDNILTKKILTKINGYLSSPTDMTRPERRCLKDMVTGILKSRSVFVNQIAASLREPLKLKDVAKAVGAVPEGGLRRQGTGGPSGDGRPGRIEGRFHRHGRYRYQ
jgi:hypothetical protein